MKWLMHAWGLIFSAKLVVEPLWSVVIFNQKHLILGSKHQVVAYTERSQIKHENRHIQLVREYGFHPRTKASVEDGALLPRKFEPFPQNMYGKPLEEIDSFIYEEVSYFSLLIIFEYSHWESKYNSFIPRSLCKNISHLYTTTSTLYTREKWFFCSLRSQNIECSIICYMKKLLMKIVYSIENR